MFWPYSTPFKRNSISNFASFFCATKMVNCAMFINLCQIGCIYRFGKVFTHLICFWYLSWSIDFHCKQFWVLKHFMYFILVLQSVSSPNKLKSRHLCVLWINQVVKRICILMMKPREILKILIEFSFNS